MIDQLPDFNSTQELIYQIVSIVISIVVPAVVYYIMSLLKNSSFASKYNLNNEKTERIMENAIVYAETKILDYTKGEISKRELALSYIEKIEPNVIKKNGDKLKLMLDRKVPQVLKKKLLT